MVHDRVGAPDQIWLARCVRAPIVFVALRAIDGATNAWGERGGDRRSTDHAGRDLPVADGTGRLSRMKEDGLARGFAGSPARPAAFDLVGEIVQNVEFLFKGREEELGPTVTADQVLVSVGHVVANCGSCLKAVGVRSRMTEFALTHFTRLTGTAVHLFLSQPCRMTRVANPDSLPAPFLTEGGFFCPTSNLMG